MKFPTTLASTGFISALIGGVVLLNIVQPQQDRQSRTQQVGVILPLSGPLAEFGEAAKNGLLLATQEHPERFKSIRFVFEDSRYDPKTSISAFYKLARDPNTALIYNWGTATGEALAPIAEAQRVPLITNSQTPSISERRAHVLRFINPAEDFSKAILNALRSRGHRRFAVVKAELAYINDLLDGINENLRDGETLEVLETVATDEQDFRSTIAKVKTKDFDALGVFLISGQISQFYRQAEAQALAVPTFGSDFFESESEIAKSGPGIEGALYSNIIVSEEFREKYQKTFSNDTHLTYASNAYDFAMLTAQIFERQTSSKNPLELLAAYQQVQDQPGTSGRYGFIESANNDKFFAFSVGVKEVKGASIQVVSGPSPLEPQQNAATARARLR
jgi:branched-chain amino acid transport system substrate-binding protein